MTMRSAGNEVFILDLRNTAFISGFFQSLQDDSRIIDALSKQVIYNAGMAGEQRYFGFLSGQAVRLLLKTVLLLHKYRYRYPNITRNSHFLWLLLGRG